MAEKVTRETVTREADDTAVQPVDDTVPGVVLAVRVVYYITGLICALLALRFIFLLLAANQGNGFVDALYGVSGFFAAPFFGIFNYEPRYGESVFEVSTVVAIVVYLLIGLAIAKLITLGSKHNA